MSAQKPFAGETKKKGLQKLIEEMLEAGEKVYEQLFGFPIERIRNSPAIIKAATWAYENRLLIACGVGVAASAIILAYPGCISTPLLSLMGFTEGGVKAASAAAAAHSCIGNVGGGSSFAILQSAGAGGSGLAIVNGVVQWISGTVVVKGVSGFLNWIFG